MTQHFTIQAQLIAGLLAKGYKELTAQRYVGCKAFAHPDRPTRRIFVGKGGSFRAGQNRVSSMVISRKFTEEVLAAGQVALYRQAGADAQLQLGSN